LRHQALAKISTEGKCINCGCDLVEILEINHKNGGGNKEMDLKYFGNTINFLKDIISGNRKTDDLEIRCKVCNTLHYVDTVLKIQGFKVKYEKPSEILI
jgi:hypothetical protein